MLYHRGLHGVGRCVQTSRGDLVSSCRAQKELRERAQEELTGSSRGFQGEVGESSVGAQESS